MVVLGSLAVKAAASILGLGASARDRRQMAQLVGRSKLQHLLTYLPVPVQLGSSCWRARGL